MRYLELATKVSNQSYGNVLLSAFALPRNVRQLEDIAKTFDTEDNRYGVFLVEIRNQQNAHITTPVAIMMGDYQTVLRAALCLAPVAELYYQLPHNRRNLLENNVHIIRVPTGFDFMEVVHKDDGQFMSFVEFSETRTALGASDLNSEYTGEDRDNEDHIKGFLYGEDFHKILITECDHTDICAVKYNDFYFGEEDADEAEAVAYRCYLNSKGYYADAVLADHFTRPLGKRRVSLTY